MRFPSPLVRALALVVLPASAAFAAPAAPVSPGAEDERALFRQAFEEGRHDDARALLRGPAQAGEPEALHWLGRVELVDGNADEALELFERLRKEQPDQADSHFWYGRACHLKVDQVGKVFQIKWARRMRSAFERANELAPEDPKVQFALTRFHREAPGLVGGDRELAWSHARELARLDPVLGEPVLGEMHREDEAHAEAAEAYARAVAVSPDDRGLNYLLAITLADAGLAEESFAAIAAWTERVADDPIVPYLVGRTAAVSGKGLSRGRVALEGYLEGEPPPGGPSHAAAHWRLGNLREHAGERGAARESYRAALKVDPDFKRAKESLKALRKP